MIVSARQIRTVAVTGASGLLGRYLCEYLRSRGWRVNALVRDTDKYPFAHQGIRVFKCVLPDIIDINSIKGANVLIHCAYMTRFTSLEEATRVNEEGTRKLYEMSKGTGIERFIFVSSRAARPGAKSYYAQSKHRMELMMDVSKDLIIRPGLILSADGGLFHRMVNQVKKYPVIPVFGGGHQQLNTVHIEDLCRLFEWALDKKVRGAVTIAEQDGITMKELLRAVLAQLGQKKIIISVPGRPLMGVLRILESFGLKLPVSSENLRGLLNREDMGEACSDRVKQSGINIRSAQESIRDLIPRMK
jgi:NADH dehydrogenase